MFLFVHKLLGIIHRQSDQLARCCVIFHLLKLNNHRFIVFEAIFFEEKGHKQPVDAQNEILRISAVEDVVGELEFHFTVNAVSAGDATDLKYFFWGDH